MPLKFIKARNKSANGPGEWMYFEWNPDAWGSSPKSAEENWAEWFMATHGNVHHEHYRGCDVEPVDCPPKEWLESQIEVAQEARKAARVRIRRYSRLLGQDAPRNLWSTVSQEKVEELALVALALVGMGHELNSQTSQFWYSANRLQAMLKRVPAALGELGQMTSSFKHIEHMIRQTRAVLPPSLRQSPKVITGEAIYNYVAGFRAHPLRACGVTLTATPEFRAFEFTGQFYRIPPVFLSLVENSLYWIRTQHRNKDYKKSDYQILFDTRGDGVIVADTGTGISPDMLPVLFEPFRSNRYGGRGMGLYLARLMLERDGYFIDVKDDGPFCGACFIISPNKKAE